jgi:tetratricopeptide (TPR) repeat protein
MELNNVSNRPAKKTPLERVKNREYHDAMEDAKNAYLRKDLMTAASTFRRAVFFRKDSDEAHASLGDVYVDLCDFSSAIVYYKRAMKLKPNDVSYKERLARVLDMQGIFFVEAKDQDNLDKALCNFESALNLCSTRPEYWLHFTLALTKKGEFASAVKSVTEYCALVPEDAEAHILRAKLLWKLGDPVSRMTGFEALQDASRLNPKHMEVKFFEGVIRSAQQSSLDRAEKLLMVGDVKGAIEEINAHHTEQLDAKAILLRGRCYRRQGRLNEALKEIELAQSRNDSSTARHDLERERNLVLNEIALQCLNRKECTRAAQLLERVIQSEREASSEGQIDARFLQNLGDAYMECNEFDRALSLFNEASKSIASKSLRTRIAIVHNMYAIQSFNHGKHEEALKSFNRAIRHDSSVASFYANRGVLKFEGFRDFEGARLDFDRALKLDPKNSLALKRLAQFRTSSLSPKK